MEIKTLKILTILTYCFIPINGAHIGGPLILMLLLSLSNGSALLITKTIFIFIALGLLTWTISRPNRPTDKILIPVLLLILFVPLTLEVYNIIDNQRWVMGRPFLLTVGLFTILALGLTFLIYRQQKTATNSTL